MVWLLEAVVPCCLRKGLGDTCKENTSGRAGAVFCFPSFPQAKTSYMNMWGHINTYIPTINVSMDIYVCIYKPVAIFISVHRLLYTYLLFPDKFSKCKRSHFVLNASNILHNTQNITLYMLTIK